MDILTTIPSLLFGIFLGYKFKQPLATILNYSSSIANPTKLVIVTRQDLELGKGKLIAQCCHATLSAYKSVSLSNPKLAKQWMLGGQAKVVVKAKNLSELEELKIKAEAAKVCASLIQDAGRTQIQSGTKTVLAVGPDRVDAVNKITGHLKLL